MEVYQRICTYPNIGTSAQGLTDMMIGLITLRLSNSDLRVWGLPSNPE